MTFKVARSTYGPEHGVPAPVAPYCHAARVGGWIYLTGQIPIDAKGQIVGGGIAKQTDQVMANLAAVLSQALASLSDLVSVRAFLVDMDEYAAFNAAYEAWFGPSLPTRTCIGVTGLALGVGVEIDGVAWRPE